MYKCRTCNSENIYSFLDLGMMPLADALVNKDKLSAKEAEFPLEVVLCEDCSLVQITETVDPEILFCEDYPYYSSFSPHLLEHSKNNVVDLIESRKLDKNSFVVEVASNDGYLLKNYVDAGIPVLGVDPASGPVATALENGVNSVCEFFGLDYANKLVSEGKRADVIHGNNVMAHVADTNGFVAGLAALLKDDGVVVIEAPYVRDLIQHLEFDTIYHEHLCYFSATSASKLFEKHGLYLNDVKWLPIHGGSLRYFAGKKAEPTKRLLTLLEEEREAGLGHRDYYANFGRRVATLKNELHDLISGLRKDGKRIAAYGAAAKGATLVNYVGLGDQLIDFVVDRNVHKQGKYMPGENIPIHGPEKLMEAKPDYVLVLAWNFMDEIKQQQSAFLAGGGKFIRPVPNPVVVD